MILHKYMNAHTQGRKEMFYLTTHSTHFIDGYMTSEHTQNKQLNFTLSNYEILICNIKTQSTCTVFLYFGAITCGIEEFFKLKHVLILVMVTLYQDII